MKLHHIGNDNARSIWTLLDHEQKVQYNGPAEPSDPNNRYFLLYTNHNDGNAHVLPITQVNLQKANTSVRFKTIEEVEAYQKSRIKLAKAFKPEDLGLDFDIASVTQSIKNDRLKKSKKGGSNGAKSSSSKRSNGGIEEGDDIDYDDAEDVWEVNDDDEGIQNKDLVDFEDTGDWQGGKKSEYVLGEGDVDLGDEQNDTTLQDVYFQKDENNDDEGSSGDEDNTMGDGPSSISANGLFGQGGTKRKTLNEVNYASEEGNVGVQKRQKPPVKKK